MITKLCRTMIFSVFSLCLCWLPAPVQAQKPPTDLLELNLEQILSLRINRQKIKRWTVGYRAVYAKFEGYCDGTDDLKLRPDVLGRPSATALQ